MGNRAGLRAHRRPARGPSARTAGRFVGRFDGGLPGPNAATVTAESLKGTGSEELSLMLIVAEEREIRTCQLRFTLLI